MKKKILILVLIILMIGVGGIALYKGKSGKSTSGKGKIIYYRNPMNASITSPVPMKDEMGMDYIPVYTGEEKQTPLQKIEMGATVTLNDNQAIKAGVKTDTAKVRHIYKNILTVGRIAYDPELVIAQQEYLSTLEILDKLDKSSDQEALTRARNIIEQAKYRLKLLGMSEEQITELGQNKTVQDNLILPGHSVWVYADIYQEDVPLVKIGDEVEVTSNAVPGEIFEGTVKAIDPVLNEMTRSVKVRAEIANHEFKLKPEMYVKVNIAVHLGEELTIPKEAVLDTGLRKVSWVDKDNNIYERREVEIGPEVNAMDENSMQKYYPVFRGLEAGEKVVTRANFLIDSQSVIGGEAAAYSGAISGETKKSKQDETVMPAGHRH